MINNQQDYVDYKVSNVMPIKNKFGFRITLYYADKTSKIIQRAGFDKKKDANKARDKVLGELALKTFAVDSALKVKDFLNDWLENIMRNKITYNTYMSYRNAIRHINEAIGDNNLLLLKSSVISDLYRSHADISLSVTKQMRVVLLTALDYAVSTHLLTSNPAHDARFPGKKLEQPGEFRVRHINEASTLDEEQLHKLIEASKDTPIYLQVLFATLLGLRKSEINGLKYSDIDYVNKTLHVQRQIGKKMTKTGEELNSSTKDELPTKTLSGNRVLQLPDLLFEAILQQRQKYEKQRSRRKSIFNDSGYICCCYNGNPRSKNYVFKPFKKLLKDCGLPDIRWHDLRTSYCTILLKANFSPKAVSVLMGHAKEIVTVDVYGDNKNIGDCLDELEPFIEEVLPRVTEFNVEANFGDTLEYSTEVLTDFLEEESYKLLN